jgi:hypothetical protein
MTKQYTRQIKPITQKDLNRFWKRVKVLGEDDCWIWQLKSTNNGYGLYAAGGQIHRTSRFAYIHQAGLYSHPIESDFRITAGCRNKLCCNPRHLKQASQQEVFDIMRKSDQITVGSKHKMSKLTEADIPVIRARYVSRSATDGLGAIGVDYGVTIGCIRDIIIRKTWRHV